MNIIEDLENKIALILSRIEYASTQLEKHNNGDKKLTLLSASSLEMNIEKNRFLLDKHQKKLQELSLEDLKELEENEKKKEKIRKNNYYKYQMLRIKHNKKKKKKVIISALSTLKDIPEELNLKDNVIFALAHKSRELFLDIHSGLDDELLEIKSEFLRLVKNKFNETNNELKLLNSRIPIIILQLKILLENIKQNIKEEKLNKKEFKGLPRFEDWWIHELWDNPQAYMGLFKWQEIVLSMAITTEQRKAFEMIFKNWILIKKLLNTKAGYGYFYNHAFDEMIFKYTGLEDEYDKANLKSMDTLLLKLTKEENLTSVSEEHTIMTPYMKFKIEKQEIALKDNL